MELNNKINYILAAVIVGFALYASSLYSYLLFHSMSELFSIAIALSVFVIAWNTQNFSPNSYLLFMGITFLPVAFIDLLHTLAYKGMGVFKGYDANLPTQLWIAGRYMQAVSFLAAPYFIGRKLKCLPVVVLYSIASAVLLISIFNGLFTNAFVEGSGLTSFKIISEYIISLILAAAIIYLRKKKEYFEKPVLDLLIWSMIVTIASEMAFTLYTDVYGFSNLLGHYFKIAAYYLLYAAVVRTNLKKSYETLAHEIDERKKTEEKQRSVEALLRQTIEIIPVGIWVTDEKGNIIMGNKAGQAIWAGARYVGVDQYGEYKGWWVETGKKIEAEEWALARAVRKGEISINEEVEIECFDGTHKMILNSAVPIFSADNKIKGAIVINQDITESKKAEATLRESEERLRLFAEQAPAPIAMLDENLNYVAASTRWLSGHGWNERNLIGRNMYEEFPDIPERWKEIHRRCLLGAVESSEADPWVRADGSIDWVRWEMRPWRKRDGTIGGLVVFSEDITANKKAEEELRITNEELLAINRIITTTTTTTTTGVKELLEKVLDEALNITGLEGGTICMVTPDETLHLAAHRETSEATIFDLTTNEIKIGECLCGECARDHKPLILRDREAVLKFATREATRGEDLRFHAAYPLIIGERCLGVLCVFTRTDKKPAERSLKLLETVTAQIAIAVDNAQMFEEISRHAATLEDEVRERTADLKESQTALINIVEDLNTKTEELKAANEKLKEMDRLKSMFIASMSHELRTPLNSVIGFSSILLNEWPGPLNDEQKNNLSAIFKSGKHLLALINDVIDVSKIEAEMVDTYIEDFDLNDVITEAVDTIKKDAEAKKLELKIDSIHQMMHTDRRRLFQCVLNLLSNAVKFTERGSVLVAVRRIQNSIIRIQNPESRIQNEDKEEIRIQESEAGSSVNAFIPPLAKGGEGGFLEISVTDTGIGIKEEDMPKLFKSFVRLDSPLRSTVLGTGLGLYLTKKLLTEILKGEIITELNPQLSWGE